MLFPKLFAEISGTGGAKVVRGNFIPNTTILYADQTIYIIDPGCTNRNVQAIVAATASLVEQLNQQPLPLKTICISNTHAHLDHSANNYRVFHALEKLIKKRFSENPPALTITLTSQIHKALLENKKFMLETLSYIFNVFDRHATLQRLGYCAIAGFFVDVLTKIAEPLAKNLALVNFMLYYGTVNTGIAQARLFEATAPGVQIIPTPGHTPDSVSFFFPRQSLLCVGDLTWYLNPNNQLGNLDDLQQSLQTVMDLVATYKIQTLVQGHGNDIHGPEEIIAYLQAYRDRQEAMFARVAAVITEKNQWNFGDLASTIYAHESFGKELLAISYTKTPSFPDFFLLSALARLGYTYHQQTKLFIRTP